MKKMKNNLDERQEQILLKLEHRGFWLTFWGLFAAIFIQMFIYDFDIKYFLGEWIVFTISAIYLFSGCIKYAIWDRHLKPNFKTNLVVSLLSAAGFGMIMFIMGLKNFGKIYAAAICGLIMTVTVFILVFSILMIALKVIRNREKKLEESDDDMKM